MLIVDCSVSKAMRLSSAGCEVFLWEPFCLGFLAGGVSSSELERPDGFAVLPFLGATSIEPSDSASLSFSLSSQALSRLGRVRCGGFFTRWSIVLRASANELTASAPCW